MTEEALDTVACMPAMEELDATPSMDAINKAVDTVTVGKAQGKDAIPSEILKSGKGPLLGYFHALLYIC